MPHAELIDLVRNALSFVKKQSQNAVKKWTTMLETEPNGNGRAGIRTGDTRPAKRLSPHPRREVNVCGIYSFRIRICL